MVSLKDGRVSEEGGEEECEKGIHCALLHD